MASSESHLGYPRIGLGRGLSAGFLQRARYLCGWERGPLDREHGQSYGRYEVADGLAPRGGVRAPTFRNQTDSAKSPTAFILIRTALEGR